MEPQYWAGIATGLGWGGVLGLVVALAVALMLKRIELQQPPEPQQSYGSNLVPAPRRFGE